jgi:tetratricopeptide (TPR) repeat protein
VTERRWLGIIGGGLFVLVLAAYVETMAGSTSFWDCGEFIATAYILGIPHPPATPLYVVLGRVFTLLPLPLSIAQRVSFMSALFGALGILVLFYLIADLIRERRGTPRTHVDRVVVYGCALVGALFTAWSSTYWTNAVEAEVYAIASFVMGLTTLLARRWARDTQAPNSTGDIYLIIYLLSLGVGFHLGTVLTYPAIALYCLLFRQKNFHDRDLVIFSFGFFLFLFHVNLKFSGVPAALALLLFLLAFAWRATTRQKFVPVATGLFVLGLSIHLFLLIRSAQQPAIDEADPQTWTNLLRVLRREQYPPGNMFVRKGSWHFQFIDHFWRYFTEQYELVKPSAGALGKRLAYLPIFLGLVGMWSMFRRNWRSFLLVFITLLISSVGLILFLNFSDGTRGVQPEVRERDYFYSGAFYFFGVFIGVGAAALLDWFFGARAGEKRVRLDVIGSVAGVTILLALTGMLYVRYHFEHDRTHERAAWGYGYNFFAGLEPNSLIFTNGDNDTFPLWYQQEVEGFRRDVRVINLSLLNTDWYIYQLQNNEPKVKIDWTRDYVDNLPYTAGSMGLQPRDLAMRQIIWDNYRTRPIYFAVTIPHESLRDVEEYLVLEGVVYRMTDTKGKERRDYAKMEHNATAVYRYDGILRPDGKRDDSVYRDANQRNLIQNYCNPFIRLAQHAEEEGDRTADKTQRQTLYAKAADWYGKALEISPDLDLLYAYVGSLYIKMDRAEEAVQLYERVLRGAPRDDRWEFQYVQALLSAGHMDTGLQRLQALVARHPDEDYLQQYLVQVLHEAGKPAAAQQAVADWEKRHPDDHTVRDFYAAVKSGMVGRLLGTSGTPSVAPSAGIADTAPAAAH